MCNLSKWAAPEGFSAPPPLFQELRSLPLFDATNLSLPTDQVDTANDNLVAGATLAACTLYADCLGDETSAYPRSPPRRHGRRRLTGQRRDGLAGGEQLRLGEQPQHDGIWKARPRLEWATPQQEVQDYADGELKRGMVRIYWGDVYAQDLDIYTPPAPSPEVGKESLGGLADAAPRVRGSSSSTTTTRSARARRDRRAACSGLEAGRQRRRGAQGRTPTRRGPRPCTTSMLDGRGSSDPSRQQQTPSVWIRLRRPAMLSYCASQATPESGWQAFDTCSCERGSRAEAAQYSIREIQVVATTGTLPPPPTLSPPPPRRRRRTCRTIYVNEDLSLENDNSVAGHAQGARRRQRPRLPVSGVHRRNRYGGRPPRQPLKNRFDGLTVTGLTTRRSGVSEILHTSSGYDVVEERPEALSWNGIQRAKMAKSWATCASRSGTGPTASAASRRRK